MFSTQNHYRLVTEDTLSVDIKDIIEQKFPRLDQDIIDDAVAYGRHQYTGVPQKASDQQAEQFFLNSVMERIHERINERIRSEYDTLIAFMLAHHRHNTQTPLTVNQALNPSFSSDLLTLPFPPGQLQKMVESIIEENRNKLIPQHLQFLKHAILGYDLPAYLSYDSDRIKKFWSLGTKLKNQIIYMSQIRKTDPNFDINYVRSTEAILNHSRSRQYTTNLKFKMFDEIYRLAQLNLNANVLERLILDSLICILKGSSLSEDEKIYFIQSFENTINNQENITTCRMYQEKLRSNSLSDLCRV